MKPSEAKLEQRSQQRAAEFSRAGIVRAISFFFIKKKGYDFKFLNMSVLSFLTTHMSTLLPDLIVVFLMKLKIIRSVHYKISTRNG